MRNRDESHSAARPASGAAGTARCSVEPRPSQKFPGPCPLPVPLPPEASYARAGLCVSVLGAVMSGP